MNRRNFFQRVFGGLSTALAALFVKKLKPPIAPSPVCFIAEFKMGIRPMFPEVEYMILYKRDSYDPTNIGDKPS